MLMILIFCEYFANFRTFEFLCHHKNLIYAYPASFGGGAGVKWIILYLCAESFMCIIFRSSDGPVTHMCVTRGNDSAT